MLGDISVVSELKDAKVNWKLIYRILLIILLNMNNPLVGKPTIKPRI